MILYGATLSTIIDIGTSSHSILGMANGFLNNPDLREKLGWIFENCPTAKTVIRPVTVMSPHDPSGSFVLAVTFYSEADAVAYKLRWGGSSK